VKRRAFCRLALATACAAYLMGATSVPARAQEEMAIEYEISGGHITFLFQNLNLGDIRDLLWDGKSIHSAVVNEKIGQISYLENGFSVAFGKKLSLKGPGVLDVILVDGHKLQRTLLTGPPPTLDWLNKEEKATCADPYFTYNSLSCGIETSEVGLSPYPCCDNTGNRRVDDAGDGNCTWFVWYKAKKLKQWTVPSWGNAGDWCRKAASDPAWTVRSTPAKGTIACGLSLGHVAWVVDFDTTNKTINVWEQNCKVGPACFGSGTRNKTWNTASFNYISKN
jgi:CHAP domain